MKRRIQKWHRKGAITSYLYQHRAHTKLGSLRRRFILYEPYYGIKMRWFIK